MTVEPNSARVQEISSEDGRSKPDGEAAVDHHGRKKNEPRPNKRRNEHSCLSFEKNLHKGQRPRIEKES
jgi:hypothetical protein